MSTSAAAPRSGDGGVGGSSGLSMLLLRHVGAVSGAERVTPLAYWVVGDDSIAVLASNFGAPKHPAWYHNLGVNPIAAVEIGAATWKVRARVARGDEGLALIRGIVATNPVAASAVERTAREIPAVVLELLTEL